MKRVRFYALLHLLLVVLVASSHVSLRKTQAPASPWRNVWENDAGLVEDRAAESMPISDQLPDNKVIAPEVNLKPAAVALAERRLRGSLTGAHAEEETVLDLALAGHVVGAGETLTEIAAGYDTSVEAIQELNGLVDPDRLLVEQELLIPIGYWGSGILARTIEDSGFVSGIVGHSTLEYPIESFRIGSGQYHVVVVGAIHGGYEWNTALLAYRLITYFSVYPELVPADATLHIIPVANPDGLAAITGAHGPFVAADISGDTSAGRFNGNGVDLNRNWGCDWSRQGQWRQESVSGGLRPLSESETRALSQFFVKTSPEVVVWLHSAAGLLVPGNCNGIVHQASERAAALYAKRAAYPVGEFGAYMVTGDAADWLAQHKVASFTVELSNHRDLEFDRNLAGLLSLLDGIDTLGEE